MGVVNGEVAAQARDAEENLDYDVATDLWMQVVSDSSASETLVLEAVLKSGLRQVRVDTGSVDRGARFPSRPINLVVEGDAASLKKFLVVLEEMPWVTRVMNLSVEQGEKIRRIALRIAVMLEAKS